MAEVTTPLRRDPDWCGTATSVALEGFTHLIPFAAGHEIIRQQRRDLSLVRMTPDVVYDQMIGMGCARRLVFSWGGNPGVGSLHRFRDAVENGWPAPLEVDEHSARRHGGRYTAGASALPFGVLRGYAAPTSEAHVDRRPVSCPFTGEELTAVPAVNPDVTVIHAQRADRAGNVQLWGIVGVQKEAVLAADRVLVTVEEVVDKLEPRPGAMVLPTWVIDAVAVVPDGAHPSYAARLLRPATTRSTRRGTRSPRPRHVPRVDGRARPVEHSTDEMMSGSRRASCATARSASSASACPARPRTSPGPSTHPTWC